MAIKRSEALTDQPADREAESGEAAWWEAEHERVQAEAEQWASERVGVEQLGTEAEWLDAERARIQAEAEQWAAERVTWQQANSTVPPTDAEAVPATGATAGTPGSFTPAGCETPADLAALGSVTASPTTAWATGEHVILGDASHASWDGTAWAAGDAP